MRLVLLGTLLLLAVSGGSGLSIREKITSRSKSRSKSHNSQVTHGSYADVADKVPARVVPANELPRLIQTAETPLVDLGSELVKEPQAATSVDFDSGLAHPPQRLETATAVEPLDLSAEPAARDEEADLEAALAQLKEDIVGKSHQVMEEKKWVDQVKAITSDYELKTHRVEVNIATLRNEVKDMFTKKKQIENLMLQKKLQSKLRDAESDLNTLQQALVHTKTKAVSFMKNKYGVEQSIDAIRQQLNKLQGKSADAPLEEDLSNRPAPAGENSDNFENLESPL